MVFRMAQSGAGFVYRCATATGSSLRAGNQIHIRASNGHEYIEVNNLWDESNDTYELIRSGSSVDNTGFRA
ncbi:uncharacterized protein EAE97_011143 [Botrytis byssoidea]|uniref:Uncharacterized protein n=1 Tax=Botrytis byssoidea TaxID=139641 RepID=A0A9P5HTC3_9HELO|nr:uncharacterized protein EAE97_011143 [Botrytis byssoidea]KAF7922401.1 hypothetical protein EAE97_011143 [Botrytis byssoidea]